MGFLIEAEIFLIDPNDIDYEPCRVPLFKEPATELGSLFLVGVF